ncbi:hypothetical protein ACFQL1_06610 [Halomicroarcula sp. GCM10025709]|uniref:hypothetical protein n=1 Tax=Halomicroarcula sp. GCM10025709 TaxID=3252669 RepID=UPI00362395A3
MSIPVGLYLAARVALDVHDGRSPINGNGPVLLGVTLGALLAALPHLLFGWAPVYRAFAPALLFTGCVAVVVLGVAAERAGLSAWVLTVGEALAGLIGFFVALAVLPAFGSAFDQLMSYVSRTGQSEIAETYSIFSGELGSIVAPILLFGFVFFLAIPYLVWGTRTAVSRSQPDWLATATFGWFFLLLAVVQSRFAGQLSLFTAVFGGVGFLHLATVIDATERPAVLGGPTSSDGGRPQGPDDEPALRAVSLPSANTLGVLTVLFLLISGLGVVQAGIKQSQIAVDDSTYETAAWIGEHDSVREVSYPENYVLSNWGRNRVYNYFVNGESESYGFARQNYAELMRAQEPSEIRNIENVLDEHGTGYVVTTSSAGPPTAVQSRLHTNLGSRGEGVPGLGRYRPVHIGDGGSPKVFAYVSGARITGVAGANQTLSIVTNSTVENRSVTYRREVTTNRYGEYGVTVPYRGDYQIGGQELTVSGTEVTQGQFSGPYHSHWAFDEGVDQ